MLENWCWEHSILQKLSIHYLTGQMIPIEICERLVRSRNVNIGLQTLRQVFFASFDMSLHSGEAVDIHHLWDQYRCEIALIPMVPGTFPYSTFGHILGGYDCGYYGYLWSQMFSADMF